MPDEPYTCLIGEEQMLLIKDALSVASVKMAGPSLVAAMSLVGHLTTAVTSRLLGKSDEETIHDFT